MRFLWTETNRIYPTNFVSDPQGRVCVCGGDQKGARESSSFLGALILVQGGV